jgi:uncharacterized repeat protein (TIGR03803 family)
MLFLLANAVALFAMVLSLASSTLASPKYKVLHYFGFPGDGGGLWSSLVFDASGNLYGTTSGGGAYGGGTVFQLTPGSNGAWSETILHSFPSFEYDGDGPWGGKLVLDDAGNLYGTTVAGGTHYSGTAFELTYASWTETILYNFCAESGCSDGGSPSAGLIADKSGSFYGTGGVAFELSPGSGGWEETTLDDFTCGNGNGCEPYGLTLGASGNLYGINESGGTGGCGGGCGTAYELAPGSGGWKERTLHYFGTGNDDIAFPSGFLLLRGPGELYGVAGGGTHRSGAVYRLSRGSDGWKATIQYSFEGGASGAGPNGVITDAAGNYYGTTAAGGDPNCSCGTIFKLTSHANGKWNLTVLHRFTGNDGAQPVDNLTLDSKGNLYGTTATGGAGGAGVAFELTP